MISNRQKGAQAVEFALVLPFLVLVLFAVFDFGILVYNKAIITNASREAARRGITLTAAAWDPASIKQVACNYARTLLITVSTGTRNTTCSGTADPVVTVTPAGAPAFGDPITVNIAYTVTGFLIGARWPLGLGSGAAINPITLTAATQMLHE